VKVGLGFRSVVLTAILAERPAKLAIILIASLRGLAETFAANLE